MKLHEEYREFNLLSTPLKGIHLIEAGAGTGKTYTITGLVLRLVVELGIPIQEILVVTFTEAATAELKERIRARIEEAVRIVEGRDSRDETLKVLAEGQWGETPALQRLKMALNDFDQAAIFTIHGFCHRVLRENAFESGTLLDMELVTDQEAFLAEVIQDFWREHLYEASPLFVHHCLARGIGPDTFREAVQEALHHPHVKVLPALEAVPDTAEEEKNYAAAFDALKSGWEEWRSEVEAILLGSKDLSRSKYGLKSIPKWLEELDEYVASGLEAMNEPGGWSKLSASALAAGVNKGKIPPRHPFFHVCESFIEAHGGLMEAFARRITALLVRLVVRLHGELARRKEERGVLYFDDLLFRLEAALQAEKGERLTRVLRETFKAALIDEFQDTDSVQYAIFRKIFEHDDTTLFLIGDPKQAIYGFRGADVFAYMQAAGIVESRFTLRDNWRSEPAAVDGMNTLFSGVERPFVYEEIPFLPVTSPPEKEHELLRENGVSREPLRLWVMSPDESTGEKPIGKTVAREAILHAVAGEIGRLVEGGRRGIVTLGDRPLGEGDVAVLLRANRDAAALQEVLSGMGIHSVLYSTASLFASEEALHMQWLLEGVADPSDGKAVKRALAGLFFHLDGEGLLRLESDEPVWDHWLEKFSKYKEVWNKSGFFVMLRKLLHDENVPARLMRGMNGERSCTNILHLGEVLHRMAVEDDLGMMELIQRLSAERREKDARNEEYQLRLESDEDAVKLVTIHRSKGLEYPVVFCPFVWDNSREDGKKPFLVHDTDADRQLTLAMGATERERFQAMKSLENLSENVRLLYVAVTRARNRCTLVWGRFNQAEASAPAYLFHYGGKGAGEGSDGNDGGSEKNVVAAVDVGRMVAGLEGLSHGQVREDLERVRLRAPHAIAVEEMPAADVLMPLATREGREDALSCRSFQGAIRTDWRISSFSSLVQGEARKAELRDYDELPPGDPEAAPPVQGPAAADGGERSIFTFPRGAGAGTFMHEIFEECDFAMESRDALSALLQRKLEEHGFDEQWLAAMVEMIQNVLRMPLEGKGETFTLSEISPDKRLHELEFYFPLRHLGGGELERVLAPLVKVRGEGFSLSHDVPELRFDPVGGFMKGFIDLVFEHEGRFYILDWKSNHLGDRAVDYGPGAMTRAMEEHFYTLQAHLYTAAVHRYLKGRVRGYDYETHFGGFFYLFLRGIDPSVPGSMGVFRDRPSAETVEGLCAALIREAGSERGMG